MTVDITQDEMNILNLNGISADDVKNNIEFHRASGLDDKTIRQQFTNTINELRPLTKQSAVDTAKIKDWKNKGGIAPFEYAQRESAEYNGTYNNIDKYANLNLTPEQIQKRIEREKKGEEWKKQQEEKIAERNERVNKGTASFLDRVGALLDRMGDTATKNAYEHPAYQYDVTAKMAGIGDDGNIKSNVDKSKPIGFNESLVDNGIMNGSWIPFAGGFLKDADVKKQRDIQEHIIKGEPIRPDELNFLNHRLEKQQEEQVRGYSLGGKVAQGFLPSLIRFGTEMAAGGYILKGLGLAAELPQNASLGTKALFGLKDMAKTGLVNTVTPIGWNDIFENYQDRMLNNELKFTDKGQWIFQNSDEKPATAFMKSLGQTFIMFASEASGQLLGIPVQGISGAASKYVGTPISKYLMNNKTLSEFTKKAIPQFSKLYEKLNGLPIKGKNLDWLKSKVKYDGFFEELGEEVVEDVLNLTIGTNNEKRSLENYAKAVFKSPDEWAVLAGAIALQGGTLSVASHVLGSHLERNGASDEQILDVLNNLSENDKEQMVENLIQDGVLNVDATDEERFEHSVNSVVDSLMQSGKFTSREKAEQAARLGATMLQNLSEKTGLDVNELIEKEMADINVSNEEMFVDKNGTLHSGISFNEGEETSPETSAADKINEVFNQYLDELGNLPDDFDDEEYVTNLVNKITVLEETANNNLSLDNIEKANDLIAEYRELGQNDIADAMEILMNGNVPITKRALNQSSELAGATPAEYKDAKKEWKEKGTDSKYFQNWFGDSKVVDENGNPLVVYHGTEAIPFSIFGQNQRGWATENKRTYYFSASKDYAKVFAGKTENSRIMECYLSLKNPLVISNEEIEDVGYWLNDKQLDELEKQGYDGFITEDKEQIVVLHPEQIKSVNNQGTFDKDNPNIYLQREINNKNIENNFGMSADEITSMIQEDIMNILDNNEVDESEFNFEDIRVYGSYSTGKNKASSDIDIMVQYSGNMKEDSAFNMFADEDLYIYDKNGNRVRVDINPINSAESGTIDEQLDYYDTLEPKSEKQLYQTALNPLDDINQRTDKSKYLTDNEVEQLKKDRENFEIYVKKLLRNELSPKTVLQVVQKLPSAYNNISELKGKKVVVNQSVYKKIIDLPNDFNKNHKVDRKRAIALPTLLSDPLYILQSTSKGHEDRFVVVTSSKGTLPKEKLSIILQPNSNVAIVSAYDEAIDISVEKKNNRVLYDKKEELSKTVATSKAAMIDNSINSINDKAGKFNPDVKNLLMTHAAKASRIDDIIQSGVFVAPSMAITKKGENQALKNFGEVLFIRKPEKIDFNEDNIFDRDIYSPRMPMPHYELKNGRVIDSYELDNIQRMDNERAKRAYGVTKQEYLLDAKKVLFMGYTRSGNPIYKPYNANSLLEYMRKENLVGGENFDYGLSSLLAKLSNKQNNLSELKENAHQGLTISNQEVKKQYDNLREEYEKITDKIEPYYIQKYVFISDAINDIVFDIVKNKKRDLSQYVDTERLPKETIKEVKDFVKLALKMPRSYFESKPLKKVYLDEFSDALVPENVLSKEQIRELSLYGIKVKEYKQGEFDKALENVQQDNPRMLFQSAYKGSASNHEVESTDYIGTGEGNIAHGWGLYYAQNKEVGENYRKGLVDYNKQTKYKYDGEPIEQTKFNDISDDNLSFISSLGKNKTIDVIKEEIEYTKEWGENNKNIQNKKVLEGNNRYLEKLQKELKLVEELEPEKLVMPVGQLYKVDIPENDELLDEQEPLSVQSDKVLNGIKNLVKELFDIQVSDTALENEINRLKNSDRTFSDNHKLKVLESLRFDDLTAREFYNHLSEYLRYENGISTNRAESKKQASLLLNKYGIKGITYNGEQDGRCYVVFDDKAVKVLKRYYQKRKAQKAKQEKLFIDNEKAREISNRVEKVKGSFIPAENLINLFKDADESTIVHEFAHWWLEKLVKYAGENEEVQQDLDEIRKFVKNNGEPFTDEQHEKFARGFETYMRTGSAKTNRLKKLFEDFKNALLSLYDSIKELGFEEEEIPEIHKLFDRLLTTENQRVKAAVFDRVNEIQTQIETIKEKQNSEIAYIDEIYNNNLEREAFDRKRENQVQEYLRLAEKAVNRVPQSVKDYAKRCRTACYEILAAALNGKYSVQYIQMTLGQNNKKAENLREQLLDVADGITTTGGMRANWYEFFGDTGVNYDTDEIDGDYKLVEQALNMVENNNFYPIESEQGEEDIGKFFGAFEYLSKKVLSLKGENKDAAYEALTRLFDKRTYGNLVDFNRLPDDAMKAIAQNLEEISNSYIEQKAGEKNLKGLKNVSLSVQLVGYLTNKLHEMKSYDPVEKKYVRLSSVNRLYGLLSHVRDTFSAKEVIRLINAHAIKSLENRQRGILNKEIQRQIKTNSKLIKVGALKRGKFDWKTNTVFSELADMNRLSLEDARKEYLRLTHADEVALGEERNSIEENPTATLDAPTDFQKVLKTKFLEYKSNKLNDLNVAATRSLLEDIIELKFEGRRAKNEDELKKALTRYNFENNLIEILNKNKFNKYAKYIARWVSGDTWATSEGTLANWESLLNAVFDKKTAQKYSLLKLESDAEVYAHDKLSEFYKKAIDIYNIRRSNVGNWNKVKNFIDKTIDFDDIQPLVNLFNEYDNETYTYKQATWNKDTLQVYMSDVDITKSQIITFYTWSLNPELKKRLITQFGGDDVKLDDGRSLGEAMLEDMFNKLSDADKNFAWLLVDTCESMYPDTNEVFIRTTGLSLSRVDNYFPSKTERVGSDIDMLHEFVVRSTNPSFIKSRRTCSRIKMDAQNPLEILLPHINKTARYVVLSERVNFLNRIFASNDIQAALIDSFGKESGKKIHQVILNQLATSTYTNYAKSITVGKSLMDKVASNYITSRIGGNLKVMFSQLTSVINYCENMPVSIWAKGFVNALKNPKETIDFMFSNCSYLKARLAGNSMNEIMQRLTSETDRLRSLKNFCSTNTKYGDIAAIAFGGKPYVDYLISSGMTKEEAFEKFVEDTLRSQQSGHNSATSAWQKKQADNPVTRMIFAFNNTNLQYERKWVDAISNYAKGETTKKEFAKAFLIYKVFNPILFTSFLTNLSIASLIRGMFGGGDDDELLGFGSDVLSSILLSNLKGYGLLGIVANSLGSIVYASLTKGKYLEQELPLISDLEETAQKLLTKDDLSFGDYIKMLSTVSDYSTGVPVTRLVNTVGGAGDIMQGEFGVGTLRMMGYGKYKANMAAKGEPPKKK